MIKKIIISIFALFSFFLMFIFGFDKINILAINSFDSSIGSYNFNIDINNYDNINLYDNNYTECGYSYITNCSLRDNNIYIDVEAVRPNGYTIITKDIRNLLETGVEYTFSIFTENENDYFWFRLFDTINTDYFGANSFTKTITYTFTDNRPLYLAVYTSEQTQSYTINGIMITKGNERPSYYSSMFKFGYNIMGNLSVLSTSSTTRDFTLNLCNKLARYDGNGYLIEGTPNCFHVITQTINTTGLINIPISSFLPFDISEDGTISFDMEFYVAYSGLYYSDLYLCPYSTSNYNCSGTKSSLIFTPTLQGYYKGEPSNNIIHSTMNYVSNNFYYKGFYLYGRGRYFNDSTNTYNYFDSKEYITFISNDVKTGANLTLDSSNNEETWSINTNVASDYIKSTSYYNSININEFFNYSIDMSKFFEHNSHFTQGTATGVSTINDYTMFWGFSSINTRVLDSNSSTTPLPGDSDLLNKYNSCSAWYDIPCQLGNAVTYVIYEAPIISPVLTFIVSFITMFSSLVSFVDLFKSFGIVFGCFIIYMFIELLHKYSK